MIEKTLPTYTVQLYIAGDIDAAKQWLRRECYQKGLCVTVEPTTFVYTGGEEQGMVIGFAAYPRFPKEKSELWQRARLIADGLLQELAQHSFMLVDQYNTTWVSRRPEDNNVTK